ncbi:uncharacterized protein G2W53_005642 [Senna tora]|uniref:Uncharacterized protein n=1 Tax=Senna tora TaxID=362788 RepID=A0A834X3U0_9FABA|nr:uncharacterized protein G2W53_005642 [Senna tora]
MDTSSDCFSSLFTERAGVRPVALVVGNWLFNSSTEALEVTFTREVFLSSNPTESCALGFAKQVNASGMVEFEQHLSVPEPHLHA